MAENNRIRLMREKCKSLTKSPGVYIMKSENGTIIYIGKAKNLKNRVSSYFREHPDHTPKVAKMVSHVYDFEFIVTPSEYEALLLECSLIKQHMPKYNILLKDDKGYHYIKITNEDYPRIVSAMQYVDDGSTYLGPYISSFVSGKTVDEVNRVFMLRTCKKKISCGDKRQRPCLNFHINRCMGVCSGKISKQEYGKIIDEAIAFIRGGSTDAVERLKNEMESAAAELDFERAAKLRDKINAINHASDTQHIIEDELRDTDFIASAENGVDCCVSVLIYRGGRLFDKKSFYLEGVSDGISAVAELLPQLYAEPDSVPRCVVLENLCEDTELFERFLCEKSGRAICIKTAKRGQCLTLLRMSKDNAIEELSLRKNRTGSEITALEELKELLGLEKPPVYIEAYDISNLSSSAMVAGMVVFENGRPLKNHYKKFSIKNVDIQNDYASMREVLERRFLHFKDETESDEGFLHLPDLIFVDGGKGQVNAVLPSLREMGINVPVFGIVKDSKHRTRAISSSGGEISVPPTKPAFMLITRIQDEMHRFAIGYQRKKHTKQSFESELMRVRGIGPKKTEKLIRFFKTRDALKGADKGRLMSVAGIDEETAESLYKIIQNF